MCEYVYVFTDGSNDLPRLSVCWKQSELSTHHPQRVELFFTVFELFCYFETRTRVPGADVGAFCSFSSSSFSSLLFSSFLYFETRVPGADVKALCSLFFVVIHRYASGAI